MYFKLFVCTVLTFDWIFGFFTCCFKSDWEWHCFRCINWLNQFHFCSFPNEYWRMFEKQLSTELRIRVHIHSTGVASERRFILENWRFEEISHWLSWSKYTTTTLLCDYFLNKSQKHFCNVRMNVIRWKFNEYWNKLKD